MDELISWVTNGSYDLSAYTIIGLFALCIIMESLSVAIGHMASLGRS